MRGEQLEKVTLETDILLLWATNRKWCVVYQTVLIAITLCGFFTCYESFQIKCLIWLCGIRFDDYSVISHDTSFKDHNVAHLAASFPGGQAATTKAAAF